MYDPRREQRRQATRVQLPDDVEARELDAETRRDLRPLSKDTAELVARHLVMTGRLLDDEPERALAHAQAAAALAGRIAVVREASGLAAYAAGQWQLALAELRTARRISGRPAHLAVLADCERGLDRPERALKIGEDPDVRGLSPAEQVELAIVLSGARRDMGQHGAAALLLQESARRTASDRPWAVRLYYAYAEALLADSRAEASRSWFARAAGLDRDGETDAVDRLLELDGVQLEQMDPEEDDPPPAGDEASA